MADERACQHHEIQMRGTHLHPQIPHFNQLTDTQSSLNRTPVTWYSSIKNPELKAAVIHEELHVGYAFFVVPSDPTSLEVIWTPYTKLLETIKEQSR